MQRPDRLIVSMFGFDALALVGLLITAGSIAFALLDSAVFWLACIGAAVTLAAVVGRGLVARKLRPLSRRITIRVSH
jgi:hypothetical protein